MATAFIGAVEITVVEKVSRSKSVNTTEHALEEGEPVTDHVENTPIQISISGYLEDNSEENRLTLEKYMETGELLIFDYTTRLENVVITSFNSDKDYTTRDGYTFSMSLKQIRIASRPPAYTVDPATGQQVNDVSNEGIIQPDEAAT